MKAKCGDSFSIRDKENEKQKKMKSVSQTLSHLHLDNHDNNQTENDDESCAAVKPSDAASIIAAQPTTTTITATSTVPPLLSTIPGIRLVNYVNESYLDYVMTLVGKDLSEPYSSTLLFSCRKSLGLLWYICG
jgi:hypothetical protein